METWTAAHLAEKGDKVTLVRPLRIWRYLKTSWKVWSSKDFPSEDKTLSIGTEGIVVERETFIGSTHYTVEFDGFRVEHIHPMFLEVML